MIELEVRPWVGDSAATMEKSGALLVRVILDGEPLHYEKATIVLGQGVKRVETGELLQAGIGDFLSVALHGVAPESEKLITIDDLLWESMDDPWLPGEIRCNVSRIKVIEPRDVDL